MRKIAEEASLSVNTLYNLWGTREEILRALTLDARDRMEASLPIDPSPKDPIEYCETVIRHTIQEICRQHDLFRPMLLAWLEGEIAGQASPVEPMQNGIEILTQILEAARDRDLLINPVDCRQVAWQIQHGGQYASVQWALGRISDSHFEARALYGQNLAFLGIVQDEHRPKIRKKLKALERKLAQALPKAGKGSS